MFNGFIVNELGWHEKKFLQSEEDEDDFLLLLYGNVRNEWEWFIGLNGVFIFFQASDVKEAINFVQKIYAYEYE